MDGLGFEPWPRAVRERDDKGKDRHSRRQICWGKHVGRSMPSLLS
jgi:hypothetical protein